MSVLTQLLLAIPLILLSAQELSAQTHEWTDSSGKFKVQAELVKVEGNTVTLRRADGKETSLPLDRLSDADQQFIREQSLGSKPAGPLDAVVRIIVPLPGQGRQHEMQLVGCAVRDTQQNKSVVLTSRMAIPQSVPPETLDAGLAKAEFLNLRTPEQVGTASRLGFTGPQGNRVEGMHEFVIVLFPAGELKLSAIPLASSEPSEGDVVRLPLLPQPQRGQSKKLSEIRWTNWTVKGVSRTRMYVEPQDGQFPSTGTLPILNANDELVGLYIVKVVLADHSKVGDCAPLSVIRAALEKAGVSAADASAGTTTLKLPDFPPIATGPIDNDAPWRKSYEALVETVSTKQDENGKWTIDWGAAGDLGAWYERSAFYRAKMLEAMQNPQNRRHIIQQVEPLEHEIKVAAERLKGVVWTAVVDRISASSNSSSRFDLPDLPAPLRMSFWVEEDDSENWKKVQKGDHVKFACRFTVMALGENPAIDVRMTLLGTGEQ